MDPGDLTQAYGDNYDELDEYDYEVDNDGGRAGRKARGKKSLKGNDDDDDDEKDDVDYSEFELASNYGHKVKFQRNSKSQKKATVPKPPPPRQTSRGKGKGGARAVKRKKGAIVTKGKAADSFNLFTSDLDTDETKTKSKMIIATAPVSSQQVG